MQKVLICEKEPEIIVDYLESLQAQFDVIPFGAACNHDDIVGIVVRSAPVYTSEYLSNFSNLKYIFRVGVGTDNIDVEYCKKHGIQIVINPGANSHSVADLALWGTLTLLRRTKLLMQDLSVGKFSSRFTYQGNELVSKVVTIVGFGHVGKLVYNRLKAFGVQDFMIVDPFLDRETIEAFDGCAKCESLEEVIGDTDLLYLHLPLNEHTRDTINYALLSQTKSNIQIINLSRGGIIKESDLYNFLKTNTQAGAYLDVWEGDPEFTEIIKQLMQLDNCLISPHLGSVTEEATKKMHSFQL